MKTCSKKGPWHAWSKVKIRTEVVRGNAVVPIETIYRCGCGYLGIQTVVMFTEDVPDLRKCEFQGGCKKLATHLAGNTLFCKAHAPEGAEGPPAKTAKRLFTVL